jgi:hypothetical protein
VACSLASRTPGCDCDPVSSIWGNIPAGISALVALGSALWSAVSAVRSRKARAETDQLVKDAANAAIRSADAESQAAAVLARLTAVHEEQARIGPPRDPPSVRPPEPLQFGICSVKTNSMCCCTTFQTVPASMSLHLVSRYGGPRDLLGARSTAAHRS